LFPSRYTVIRLTRLPLRCPNIPQEQGARQFFDETPVGASQHRKDPLCSLMAAQKPFAPAYIASSDVTTTSSCVGRSGRSRDTCPRR
jgi:hypothetical protein